MDYKKLVKVIDSGMDRTADGEKVGGGYTLYSSEEAQDADVLREYCEANDIPVPEEGSDDWYEISREYDDMMWEEFFHSVLPELDKCGAYVLTGKVGKWDGDRNIAANVFDDLGTAINACMPGGAQSDMIISTTDDGGIQIIAKHHDGQNVFEIHGLNADGVDLHDEGNDDELGDSKYWEWILDSKVKKAKVAKKVADSEDEAQEKSASGKWKDLSKEDMSAFDKWVDDNSSTDAENEVTKWCVEEGGEPYTALDNLVGLIGEYLGIKKNDLFQTIYDGMVEDDVFDMPWWDKSK